MAFLTETTRYSPVGGHRVWTPRAWRQDTACPSVLAPVSSLPREGFLLGAYVLFPYQPAKGLSQITFASQSNAYFLKSQPSLDLWLDDLTPSHLGG